VTSINFVRYEVSPHIHSRQSEVLLTDLYLRA
jgi:hypothetical protein